VDQVQLCYRVIPSPIGDLVAWGDGEAFAGLDFTDSRKATAIETSWHRDDAAFDDVAQQLRAYFDGELKSFEVKLETRGTPFQRRVWGALQQILYGSTTTYGSLANELGAPRAVRAVGLANGRNPISIIIPCHRVIGADGGLTGYGGGLHRKRWLLAHERGEQGVL
jgi:methylated-DNA-[protein]-cysteine S-methyltransferase